MFYMFTSESVPSAMGFDVLSVSQLNYSLIGVVVEALDSATAQAKAEAKGIIFNAKTRGLRMDCGCDSCPNRWDSTRWWRGEDAHLLVEGVSDVPNCTEPQDGLESFLVLYADGTEKMYYLVD